MGFAREIDKANPRRYHLSIEGSIGQGDPKVVLSRKSKNSAQSVYPRQRDQDSIRKDVYDGLKAIIELSESGHISEETASDLIKVLYAGYIGAAISRQVEDYFDNDFTRSLLSEIEKGIPSVGRE